MTTPEVAARRVECRPRVGGSGLRLWTGRTAAGDRSRPEDLDLLDEAEQQRWSRLRFDRHRAQYAGARAAVRRVVAGELGVPLRSVVWGRADCPGCGSDRHGPPVLREPGSDWRVSVSRSGDRWLLALSLGEPVGVDLEVCAGQDLDAVFRGCLTADERAYVTAREGPEREEALLRCWVRKEAVVKAWGVGLGTDLRAVNVRPAQAVAVVPRGTGDREADRWEVRDVDVGDDVLAALARPARTG